MKKILLSIVMILSLCGCFSIKLFDKPQPPAPKTVQILVANPNNVYRNATNIVIDAMILNEKGEWVKDNKKILIPAMWYIGSGVGMEDL
jgi:hypothetical protein